MQIFYAVNGEKMNVTVKGAKFLDLLTLGLWGKIGIPVPLYEADALLVGRILRNYARLQRYTIECGESPKLRLRFLGYEQKTDEEISWVEDMATFFEKSGGLTDGEDRMTVSHYSERVDDGLRVSVDDLGDTYQVTVNLCCLIFTSSRAAKCIDHNTVLWGCD